MNLRPLRRAAGTGLLVSAMTVGVLGVTTAASSAHTVGPQNPGTWYVATSGTNNNSCTQTSPCKTIDEALAVEASSADGGGTINVGAGKFVGQVTATPVNDDVTIQGASTSTTTIQPPASGLDFDTDTDSSEPQYSIVDVQPGTTGLDLSDLTVNGKAATNFFTGCGDGYDGVYYHEASGSLTDVNVTEINLPGSLWGCQQGQGIYVNSTEADPANVSMTTVGLKSAARTTTTSAKVKAGSISSKNLKVANVPSSFHGGYISIDGNAGITASVVSSTELVISGTMAYAAPSGSLVNYKPYTGAYDKNGITCDDQWTTCDISAATVQGVGPTNGTGQNGIQIWGAASGTVTGSHITGDTYTGGTYSASGILAANDGTLTLTGNTISNSDENVYVGWGGEGYNDSENDSLPVEGATTISGNIITGATSDGLSAGTNGFGEGIQLDGLNNNDGTTPTAAAVVLENNQVSGSAQGGIFMTGDIGANIGEAGNGNILTSNEAGIIVAGPSTECEIEDSETNGSCSYGTIGDPGSANVGWGSTGNTISSNTIEGNEGGVIVQGAEAPTIAAYGLQPDPNGAYNNDFNGNTWAENLLANVVDFSGYGQGSATQLPLANQYGANDPSSDPSNTPADSCEPFPGDSASVNGIIGAMDTSAATSVGDSTTHDGATLVTTSSSSGFSSFSTGWYITDTSGEIPNGTTVSSIDAASPNNYLQLGTAATGNSGAHADTVSQGSFWAC